MFECPRCSNEEFAVGAKFCKICGLHLDGVFKENKLGDTYLQQEIAGGHLTNKKRNVEYWDSIDGLAQSALEDMATAVGIHVSDWGDMDDIKKAVETMKDIIEERFGVKFPYVEGDF